MNKVILAYVPVLHQGYWNFFAKYPSSELYIFGDELISKFDYLRKDVRRILPALTAKAVKSWAIFKEVNIASEAMLWLLNSKGVSVTMPDDDISREVARLYLSGCSVEFVSVFLRWDRTRVLEENEVQPDRVVLFDSFVYETMQAAVVQAQKATNLWRQVGAVAVRDGKVLLSAYNTQVPSSYTPYFEGDPRMFFKRGVNLELTTDEHAESVIVGEAAARGIPLRGADLFITTFPCPPCAKLVARTGFRRLYFAGGYAKLDGERNLRERGVEIIRVAK